MNNVNLLKLKARCKIIWNHLSCLVGEETHLTIQTPTHTHTRTHISYLILMWGKGDNE